MLAAGLQLPERAARQPAGPAARRRTVPGRATSAPASCSFATLLQLDVQLRLMIQPTSATSCRQTLEGTIRVKVFGLGKIVEGIIRDQLAATYRHAPLGSGEGRVGSCHRAPVSLDKSARARRCRCTAWIGPRPRAGGMGVVPGRGAQRPALPTGCRQLPDIVAKWCEFRSQCLASGASAKLVGGRPAVGTSVPWIAGRLAEYEVGAGPLHAVSGAGPCMCHWQCSGRAPLPSTPRPATPAAAAEGAAWERARRVRGRDAPSQQSSVSADRRVLLHACCHRIPVRQAWSALAVLAAACLPNPPPPTPLPPSPPPLPKPWRAGPFAWAGEPPARDAQPPFFYAPTQGCRGLGLRGRG